MWPSGGAWRYTGLMARALALLGITAVSCTVDPLLAEGRPCASATACGPDLVCDLDRHRCVRAWVPLVDARGEPRKGDARSDAPQPTKQVDLLFVIDNSAGMADKQLRIQAGFKTLLEGLRAPMPAGPLLDLRLGIVTTDLGTGTFPLPNCTASGDGGKLQTTARVAGCTPPSDPWLALSEGALNVPGSGDLLARASDAFACLATLGAKGCGLEQPLEAARVALDPARAVNPGFRRSGALLVIVFLTDEDDCSVAKPELFDPANPSLSWLNFRCTQCGLVCEQADLTSAGTKTGCVPGQAWLVDVKVYASFFKALAPQGRVMLAALAGPATSTLEVELPNPNQPTLKAACAGATPSGFPPIRLAAVVSAMGASGIVNPAGTDICSPSYGPALGALAAAIRAQLGL